MTDVVVDLLARLREDTRRGAGREVDLYHPAPSTRGTGEGSESGGQTQPLDGGLADRIRHEQAIQRRLFDGSFVDADVDWARERLRTPNLLTRGGLERLSCEGCQWQRPVKFGEAVVAGSPCELDGVCWKNERAAIAAQRAPLPLWRLRKLNGKPNYRSASEQQTFLRESGLLAASAKNKSAGKNDLTWEEWVEQLGDPLRVPPKNADHRLLASWQILLIDDRLPIEKLADAPVPAATTPWRQWDGDKAQVEPCEVCGGKGGYSVAGLRYCGLHVKDAETAHRRGDVVEDIEYQEVAA